MNDSPRLRRLRLDNGRLDARFRNWPTIRITGMAGSPPEQITHRPDPLLPLPARGDHCGEPLLQENDFLEIITRIR